MTNHIDLRKFLKKSKKVIIQWSKEIVFIYGGRTGNTYEQGKKKIPVAEILCIFTDNPRLKNTT